MKTEEELKEQGWEFVKETYSHYHGDDYTIYKFKSPRMNEFASYYNGVPLEQLEVKCVARQEYLARQTEIFDMVTKLLLKYHEENKDEKYAPTLTVQFKAK